MSFDLTELPSLLQQLYVVVDRLEQIAPGRRFTLDGHLVGSIGEAVAAYAYDLKLLTASAPGVDAVALDGRRVQIKLTQRSAVALRYNCEHLLVLQLDRRRGVREIYNGPGDPIWQAIAHKADVGRQRIIRVSALRKVACDPALALVQVREFPAILPKALEAAGAEFTNGDAPGAKSQSVGNSNKAEKR